jgi:hypothetical protein
MTGRKQVDLSSLRFGNAEFDRVMGQVLRLPPEAQTKVKGRPKTKKPAKKKTAPR